MAPPNQSGFLRTVLLIDTVTCVATGLLMTIGSGMVGGLTHLPGPLLAAAGASLFPIAAFIVFVATRMPRWSVGVRLVILGNAAWVAASLWLLIDVVSPNGLGTAFILLQAAAVAVLAALEFAGLRNGRTGFSHE